MQKEQLFQVLSQKTGKTQEDIQKDLTEIYKELKTQMPSGYPEDQLQTQALARLRAAYRKQLSSRAEEFTGVIIGAMQKTDMVKNKRAAALEQFRLHPEEALNSGIVNATGDPLEWDTPANFEKLPDWARKNRYKENPAGPHVITINGVTTRWIGNTLPLEDFSRNVFLWVKQEKGWTRAALRLRGENCDQPIPRFAFVKFSAIKLQSSTDVEIKLNDVTDMRFTVIKELEDTEAEGLLRKENPITLSQLDSWIMNQNNASFGSHAVIKVLVTEIVPRLTATGRQIISVEDDTVEITDDQGNIMPAIGAFLLPDIPLTFPEKSEVWLVGQPFTGKAQDGSPKKGIVVYGVYVPKLYRKSIAPSVVKEEMKW